MYLQIMEQIKNLVINEVINDGDKLPSIRELAVASKVSVITVKRAYRELESAGIITTQQGKGSFVTQDNSMSIELKQQEMKELLTKLVDIANSLNMKTKELTDMVIKIKGES